MTKKSIIIIISSLSLLVLIITSCSNDDEKLSLDGEKFVKIESPISYDEFINKAIGEWQETEHRYINADGTLQSPVDFSQLVGGHLGRMKIENEIIFRYRGTLGIDEWQKYSYTYNPLNNSIYIDGQRVMQILSITEVSMIAIESSYPNYSYCTYVKK